MALPWLGTLFTHQRHLLDSPSLTCDCKWPRLALAGWVCYYQSVACWLECSWGWSLWCFGGVSWSRARWEASFVSALSDRLLHLLRTSHCSFHHHHRRRRQVSHRDCRVDFFCSPSWLTFTLLVVEVLIILPTWWLDSCCSRWRHLNSIQESSYLCQSGGLVDRQDWTS